MSIEIHVFFRGKLPTKPALAKAMKELGFPITIPPPKDSLEKQSGFLPMRLRREEAGAEFDVFEGRDSIKERVGNKHIQKVNKGFDRCASFRWGGNENEMVAATCAAAALAKLVGGVVYDPQADQLLTVNKATAEAKGYFDAAIKQQKKDADPKQRRRGTSPSDLKRYLWPLIELRDDLVLVGRYLVIRPVRHIVRGALLDYFSKDQFRIWCYLNPLYAPAGLNYSADRHFANCRVWQPHFQELLMDGLAEDVFAKAGSITTLGDFVTGYFDQGYHGPQLISYALAGDWDQAAAYFEQTQKNETSHDSIKKKIRAEWEHISGNAEAVCAEAHAKEAEEIKRLKLEHIWERSPFPVELPAAERARVSEPAFSCTLWIERPPWLFGEMPEKPRDVRFGKSRHDRSGREFLVEPLTREEAEKRHREGEPYVRAERLPDGSLLKVHYGGRDLNDPERPKDRNHRPHVSIAVVWEGSRYKVFANASQDFSDPDVVELSSFHVQDRIAQDVIWQAHAGRYDGERFIRDDRSGELVLSRQPLTDAERILVRCPMPRFCEYSELLGRARAFMRQAGFDPWA